MNPNVTHKSTHKLLLPMAACFLAAISAWGQAPSGSAPMPVMQGSRQPTAAELASTKPTDFDMYCSGYFSPTPLASGVVVLGGQDYGLSFEFVDRNLVYLNRGGNAMMPGTKFMVLRPVEPSATESFPGQRQVLAKMGTLYEEIGRIQVQTVHEQSTTAEITHACEPVLAGDIAVPFTEQQVPPYRAEKFTDRSAPSSGKATGLVSAIKEYDAAAGNGSIVYLDMGQKQGLQVGNYLRLFRNYNSPSQDMIREAVRHYPTEVEGATVGRRLTAKEIDTLPRTVVGEVMVLSVQENSATAIVTYSWETIYPGDQVEIE